MAGKYTGFDKLKGKLSKGGDPFGKIGDLTPAQRIQRGRDGKVHEDDPGWKPKTMGNKRGRRF